MLKIVPGSFIVDMASDCTSPEKLANILGDLGKPTLRGVRKCPKCGVYNGTRGISCKNKLCDAVFRDKGERSTKHPSVDAVKIITGSTVQVFSVRLRDRGPDYRGLVQLPLVQDMDGNPATTVDISLLEQNSKCYVESCLRAVAGDSWAEDCCSHIRAAIQCTECAVPLTLKNSVLNALSVSNEMKQAIWLLATETTGPLVQRVTRTMMVVKCKTSNKHPLGFIHFAFFVTKKKRNQTEHKFQCSCKMFKVGRLGLPLESKRRCVHFYACICAFASDELLAQEFAYFVDLDNKIAAEEVEDASQYICTYVGSESLEGQAVSLKNSETHDEHDNLKEEAALELVLNHGDEQIMVFSENPSIIPRLLNQKRKKDTGSLTSLEDDMGEAVTVRKLTRPATMAVASAGRKYPSNITLDEASTGISFRQWLASVTERINQTMHYQFDGHPDPLVFHVPEPFFACLQLRINAGQKKKRLPNGTTGFVRRDALPLGVFTKYTWHITNIIQVKQIFDTAEMALEVTRSFVENRDNTYDLYEPPRADTNDELAAKNKQPIRPFELRTYLKVGHMTPDQKEPTPFTIEWIPDILPQSHIGELRIKFEYGHQRNGVVDRDRAALCNAFIAPNIVATTSSSLTSTLGTTLTSQLLTSANGVDSMPWKIEEAGVSAISDEQQFELQNIELTFEGGSLT